MPQLTDIGGRTLFFGGLMLHPHLASTVPAPDDPLQQRGALAGHAPTAVALPVLAQLFLGLHELPPTDIGGMMRLDQHRPLGSRAQTSPRFTSLGRARISPILPAAIGIRSRIGWILQDTYDSAQCR